jgi:signal transduction histidine kinase
MFNVNELLNEIVKEYKVFDTSHIFQVDADATLSLNADRKLIKQLIRIFMDNSVKYTQHNGTISLSSNEEKNKLFLIIKDNGIGINEKDLPKIFDRFYRADTSRDKKSGGSGLGLSIAKVIMDLHDAKVKVFSRPGEGTEIQIIFDQS